MHGLVHIYVYYMVRVVFQWYLKQCGRSLCCCKETGSEMLGLKVCVQPVSPLGGLLLPMLWSSSLLGSSCRIVRIRETRNFPCSSPITSKMWQMHQSPLPCLFTYCHSLSPHPQHTCCLRCKNMEKPKPTKNQTKNQKTNMRQFEGSALY